MVYSSNITLINATKTLEYGYNTYLVDANTGNIVVTLPNIVSDGQNYLLKRIDNSSNSVTITGSNNQTINSMSSISLASYSNVELHSLNNIWYTAVGINSEDLQMSFHGSSGYQILNTTNYVSYFRFIYKGKKYYNTDPIIMTLLFTTNSGGSRNFTARLYDSTNGNTISSITTTASGSTATYLTVSQNIFNNVPDDESVFELQIKLNNPGINYVRFYNYYIQYC